jgi:hypothetical protein
MPNPYNGSNNWALHGSKTASGSPLLANDPHLNLTLPAIWYEIQLSSPDVNVYGVGLAGTPGVTIGFNEHLAWGLTNTGSDVLDWLEITWKDSTRSEYLYDGEWRASSVKTEVIKVKGKADVIDKVYYTHHGPVALYSGEKAFNVMKLYITTNYGRFLSYLKDGTYISGSSGGNLLGRIVFNGDLAEISIPQDTVVSVLRTNKIFETRPVFQYWREHGQIHTNENNRFGVKDQNLQVRVIKFIFKRDEETLIPWPSQQPKIKKQIVTKVYQDNSVESAKAIDDIFAGDKSYEN